MNLHVKAHETSGVTVVHISGRVTGGDAAARLREELYRMVAVGRRKFALNLAGLSDMDSSGISLLVSLHVTLSRAGGGLKLYNVGSRAKLLLRKTNLNSVFEIFDSQAAAIASFDDRPLIASSSDSA
jgi:anti-sigma B factor antagonist